MCFKAVFVNSLGKWSGELLSWMASNLSLFLDTKFVPGRRSGREMD